MTFNRQEFRSSWKDRRGEKKFDYEWKEEKEESIISECEQTISDVQNDMELEAIGSVDVYK